MPYPTCQHCGQVLDLNHPNHGFDVQAFTTRLCEDCGDHDGRRLRVTSIGQLVTGVSGTLVTAFLLIQQLSVMLGLGHLRLLPEQPTPLWLAALAGGLLIPFVLLTHWSLLQLTGRRPETHH